MRKLLWPSGIALLIVAPLVATAAACFSDRSTGAPVGEAQCQVPENQQVDGSTVVFIRDFAFHPATVHVRHGERVTWVNCEATGGLSHTSTADAQAWASPLIAPATTFTTTLATPGTYTYHCEPHPFMTGSIIVD
jgi:plastocyanin